MIKNVFYDLDGTLLPMDMDVFVKTYFKELAIKMAAHGYDPAKLPDAVWAGTGAMVANDGTKTNEEAFWECFSKLCDVKDGDKDLFEEFYRVEFDAAKDVCGYNEKVPTLIKEVKKLGLTQTLATNPLFPEIATRKRMSWAGLDAKDFTTFTTYENCHYCKPNTKYYEELLDKLHMRADETVMIGNDVDEDMVAENIGMKVFLVTDCLLNKHNKDISKYPNGNFDDALNYIKSLVE